MYLSPKKRTEFSDQQSDSDDDQKVASALQFDLFWDEDNTSMKQIDQPNFETVTFDQDKY